MLKKLFYAAVFIFFTLPLFASEPLIIALAGGSGAGKSYLAKAIADAFPGQVEIISQDSYYKDLSHLSKQERDLVNFDHPDAIEFSLLKKHLLDLKKGKTIEEPTYDFSTHLRTSKTSKKEPKNIIVVEGILLLVAKELADSFDIKCFVDASDELRLFRRIERDMAQRGRSLASIRKQYFTTVQPMYKQLVAPSSEKADIIIPSSQENPKAVDLIISALKNKQAIL